MRTKIVKDDNFYVVQAWMVTKLKLKGLEKDIFAIIYGFTQDGEHDFHGSLDYLSQLTGYTRNRICTTLQHLIELDYIRKIVDRKDKLKPSSYVVNPIIVDTHDCPKNLDSDCPKNLDSDAFKTPTNCPKDLNIYIKNNKNTKNKENNKDVRQKTQLFQSSSKDIHQIFLDMFYEHCPSFGKITKITESRKRSITKLFKNYDKQTILKVLDKCEKSEFLLSNSKKWAKFDWIIKDSNFVKILEGNYDNSYSIKPSILDAPNNKGVKSRKFTEEERQQKERMLQEMRERGEQIEY